MISCENNFQHITFRNAKRKNALRNNRNTLCTTQDSNNQHETQHTVHVQASCNILILFQNGLTIIILNSFKLMSDDDFEI
jgi:hypothetical protein